ncbi:MAG: hypothetical protein ACE5O2_07280, partial [Armatimonadota bacterium]
MEKAQEKRSVWERLLSIDRRYIFILMALAVIIPLLRALHLPLGEISPPVRSVYDHIESLSEGDVVMLSFNFGPSS